MEGQWVGDVSSADLNAKFCIINVEKQKSAYRFYCYLLERNPLIPSGFSTFSVPLGQDEYNVTLKLGQELTVLSKDSIIVSSDQINFVLSNSYPNATFSQQVEVVIKIEGDSLNVTFESDVLGNVSFKLTQGISNISHYPSKKITWDEYKILINNIDYRKVAFRGQADTWPLRTSFHRTGRYDVINYALKDIPMLHRHISGLMPHYLNLSDPQHYGAFYNILQHHGYPTPLLDWSYSPFVAAFFAFYAINKDDSKDKWVRIFMWEVDMWRNEVMQFNSIFDCRPHISIGEYLNINNNRALPQQALTCLTNVCDIEGYLYGYGGNTDKYLKAYDISVDEAEKAMRELSMMGVTYGTLFPGIDGACYDFKKMNFPR
ncbi:FRG domain-containing protein [Enterobacter cloacae]|uniref:FRG domain-containing protein n=1 Tax=Enterobacter cloacae TaxID=550 RepID=UPI001D0328FC|nr:FRG domain-containing protein [Enterobacter cloacae]UDG02232.1 FRG domain-containing protein [Enterobacter cloacae]